MKRIVIALLAPLLLGGCLFSPGKFTSELQLFANDQFAFTYDGEIQMLALGKLAEMANNSDENFVAECYDADFDMAECSEAEIAEQRAEWDAGAADRRAEQARAQGETGAASRYLERALTMAPNSSWLYRELALLRLEEGDGHAAEGFAQRALRLAPDNDDYRAELWELVAAARAEQGDRSGADEARARAQALRQPDRA